MNTFKMSSKLIPTFLLVLLFISLCELQTPDWCSLIRPNGTFDGLGIYHRWNSFEEKDEDYVMFNKAGRQWRFKIEGSGKDTEIEMIAKSDESSVSNAIHRFGIHFHNVGIDGKHPTLSLNCNVTKLGNTHNLWCKGWRATVVGTSPTGFSRNITEFPSESVLLKAWPQDIHLRSGGNVIMVVSKDRHHTLIMRMLPEPDLHIDRCGYSDCLKPLFINQMNQELFQKIDGIVDYNFSGGSGYLLLFNINGIPKYCFTPENKDLAQECNSSEKLKSLLEGCFDETDPTPILVSTPETTDDSDKRKAIKILSVLIIIFLIILILCLLFYCCCNRRKKRRISTQTVPTGQSLDVMTSASSLSTVTSKGSSNVTKETKGKASKKPTPNSNANSSTKT